MVQRSIVSGHVDDVKTKYSHKALPLHSSLARLFSAWRSQTQFRQDTDWVFASPDAGGRLPYSPYHLQRRYITPAGLRAGLGPGIGWHTFRHSYSSMLRHLHVDVKVQQDLMRHADISTTMNIYTQGIPEDLRQANTKVIRKVLKPRAPRRRPA